MSKVLEETVRLYEAMFLVRSSVAKRNVEGVIKRIRELLTKAGAEVLDCSKWDERKLEYEIKHERRATFILARFQATREVPAAVERAARLADQVLRTLVVRDVLAEKRARKASEASAQTAKAVEGTEEEHENKDKNAEEPDK